jgi:hypothetical protein
MFVAAMFARLRDADAKAEDLKVASRSNERRLIDRSYDPDDRKIVQANCTLIISASSVLDKC